MNLPHFPTFRHLEISDKNTIEKFIGQYIITSDYYFTSLWAWDINNKILISQLNGNLVVKFTDYITGEPFYSFLGTQKINDTACLLIQKAKEEGIIQNLKLIPEIVIDNMENKEDWVISPDPDSFDYLLDVDKIATMESSALYTKLKQLRKFRDNPNIVSEVKFITIADTSIHEEILDLYENLKVRKEKTDEQSQNEFRAIERLLQNAKEFKNVEVLTVYIIKKMVGFLIFEKLSDQQTCINSFQKTDSHFKGINEFINFTLANYLKVNNYKVINLEQDLGIEGLRQAKKAYDPTFLRKYILSLKP